MSDKRKLAPPGAQLPKNTPSRFLLLIVNHSPRNLQSSAENSLLPPESRRGGDTILKQSN